MANLSIFKKADADTLAPGTALVSRITAVGAAGESTGSAAARVLSDADRERFRRGLAAIHDGAPWRVRAVLGAQWALRMDLLDAASRLLAIEPPGGCSDVERETRALVSRRLGLEEADRPR